MKRLLSWLVLIAILALLGVVVWNRLAPAPPATAPAASAPDAVEEQAPPSASPAEPASLPSEPRVQAMSDCDAGDFQAAALANAASLDTLDWAPFRGRSETGWRIYGPRIAEAVRTDCAYHSPGFAEALARWQADHRLPADGRLTPATFERMRNGWDNSRPFQRAARNGCPPGADPTALEPVTPAERYGGKETRLHPGALAAYRRMVADAGAAGVVRQPGALTIFSGFRDPTADAERCAREGNCGGAARALCSAHRTGTALDLNLGHAPGSRPDSTDDANRLWMTQTPAYRWLVRNAPRYGFVNYAFEPWHWEWAGGASVANQD